MIIFPAYIQNATKIINKKKEGGFYASKMTDYYHMWGGSVAIDEIETGLSELQ